MTSRLMNLLAIGAFCLNSTPGQSIRNDYDSVSRLTRVTYPDGTTITYTYDSAGNRLSRVVANANAGQPPAVIGATPGSGGGSNQSWVFTFSDPSGWQNLGVANVLVNNFIDGRSACYLAYSVPSSTLYLVDDSGKAGGPYAGAVALAWISTDKNSPKL